MSISVSAASNNPLLLAAQQQHNHQHPILRYTNFDFRTELPQFQRQNNDHREAHDGIDCRSIHGLERGTNGLSPRWNAMSTMMVFWWICWLGNGAAATTDFFKGGGGSTHEQGIIGVLFWVLEIVDVRSRMSMFESLLFTTLRNANHIGQ